MTTNKDYLAPEIWELEISTEGILCGSTAGAGFLEDNAWGDLTFGEPEQN